MGLNTFFLADEEAVENLYSWIRHGVMLQGSFNGACAEIEHEKTKRNGEGAKLK